MTKPRTLSPRPALLESGWGETAPAETSPFVIAWSREDLDVLGAGGVVVRDGVLGEAATVAARGSAERMMASGGLVAAGVGRGGEHRLDRRLRGDHIAWLDRVQCPPALGPLLDVFEGVRGEANRSAWLGLRRFDVQVACYPGDGVGYGRHRDSFRGPANRRLTAIWYANPHWTASDGGLLRVFGPDGALDVAPVADRLVAFLSEQVEHEVTPVHAPRFAVTAWFYVDR